MHGCAGKPVNQYCRVFVNEPCLDIEPGPPVREPFSEVSDAGFQTGLRSVFHSSPRRSHLSDMAPPVRRLVSFRHAESPVVPTTETRVYGAPRPLTLRADSDSAGMPVAAETTATAVAQDTARPALRTRHPSPSLVTKGFTAGTACR